MCRFTAILNSCEFLNAFPGMRAVHVNFANTHVGYIPIDVAGATRYVPYYA
jgi:hypothetical protein